tara:strand:+ start:571 stop:1065 length:495 start_codon:yes stop_codon:yes gene_type:complete
MTLCTSGLQITSPRGRYVANVVRVHLHPCDDIDGTAAPTSFLVQVDDSHGYGLGEERAVASAIAFADAMDGSDDHLGWINWRPEDEGPAVDIVYGPDSPGGPRPGERALVPAPVTADLPAAAVTRARDAARAATRARIDTESVAPIAPGHGANEDAGDGPFPAY